MQIFYNRILPRAAWLRNDLMFLAALLFKKPETYLHPGEKYSIGITTFLDRFNTFYKPLLKKITFLFPDIQIIVAVNGHFKKQEQLVYLKEITSFSSRWSNVKLIKHSEPQGLSSLWNKIIKSSATDKVLLLNDDLKISAYFRKSLESSNIFNEDIAVINKSWGHFLISKKMIEKVGWFDENLLEIGGEDDDYSARLALMNIPVQHIRLDTVANFSRKLKVNSYGKDMTGEHRYSAFNTDYLFNKKWFARNEPFDGAVFVPDRSLRYWKLRDS